jgi:hypothetical protein
MGPGPARPGGCWRLLTAMPRPQDYAWVTREELAEYLAPAQYDVIRQALRH